jgi:hypothetical protein
MSERTTLPAGVPPRPDGLIRQMIWLFRYAPVLMSLGCVFAGLLGWGGAWLTH